MGRNKLGLLVEEARDDALDRRRGIKQALDPLGIMNPGKIFSA